MSIHVQIVHASYENSMFGFAYITRMTLRRIKILSRNRLTGNPIKFPFLSYSYGFPSLTISFYLGFYVFYYYIVSGNIECQYFEYMC